MKASSLDLSLPAAELLAVLVDTSSVSGREGPLCDLVEEALIGLPHLSVARNGDAVVARTALGRDRRVLLGGHLDTVPVADNLPSRVDGSRLYGCGSTDMKGGVAVMLRLALSVTEPRHDLTYVFYDNEEVEAERNGLRRLAAQHRNWLDADLAILMEPTSAAVEAGCQGTLRADVSLAGRRAHSARSWLGDNAIHAAAPVLAALASYDARRVVIDGCEYREGLSAVRISGGVAGNVIPDECIVTVNFRFAPDRSEDDAAEHVRSVLSGFDVAVSDSAAGAMPGLDRDVSQEFLAAVGTPPAAKLGWTDVSRFAALGIAALNYGPGDPNLAHTRDEYVELPELGQTEDVLRRFVT
ncbi:MAG TPA: succinyl-diaminopimelate desuccinylase [Mycobacteriales bacterium]|nr:succinyl-diaminopimelate desuccinylase [Mycobacteriales bacterium]